jgi:hypothetical protein
MCLFWNAIADSVDFPRPIYNHIVVDSLIRNSLFGGWDLKSSP